MKHKRPEQAITSVKCANVYIEDYPASINIIVTAGNLLMYTYEDPFEETTVKIVTKEKMKDILGSKDYRKVKEILELED